MRIACWRAARFLTIAPLLLASPAPSSAEQAVASAQRAASDNSNRRTMVATRLAEGESITLDGRLDEPVWSRAIPAADFIQRDPDNGQSATEKTEVRIAFNSDALYLAVICYDSDPDGSIAYQRRRDELLQSDDKFAWVIDTFLDARSGYLFEMNPLGAMADALLGVNGQNRAWDGVWDARARRSDIGWMLEIELPFRTFNFNPRPARD